MLSLTIRPTRVRIAVVCCIAICVPGAYGQMGSCCDLGTCTETTVGLCVFPGIFTPGETCTPNPCNPTGACCDFATCFETTLVNCAYPANFREGETCSPSPCTTGPFRVPQAWQADDFQVVPDDPNDPNDAARIHIDTDGDNVVEIYPIPVAALADHLDDVWWRRSPDRTVIYARAFEAALSGCGGPSSDNQIYFFHAVKQTDTSGQLVQIYLSPCLNGPQPDDERLFNVPGLTQRVAYFVEPKDMPGSSTQRVYWVNLNAAANWGLSILNFDVDLVEVSPDGGTALVQHGLQTGSAESDYEIIDLCPGARLGDSLASLADLPAPAATAEVIETSPGIFAARVNHSSLPGGGEVVPLTPCTAPPAAERCCLSNGTCQVLAGADCTAQGGTPGGAGTDCTNPNCPPPVGTQACCFNGNCGNVDPAFCASIGGTPQGAGSNCLNGNITCPVTRLSITKSGPATAEQGCSFTYTLSYQNTGTNVANNVVIRDTLPPNAVFLSASHGGAPVAGVITWNIGSVPVGGGGQVTVTVAGFCTGSQYILANANYRITATPGGTFTGAPTVNTTVAPANLVGIAVAVGSVPNAPAVQPLRSGDVVTHTIAITNSTAQARCRAYFGVGAGNSQRLDAVIDSGGGTIDTSNPFSWQWSGALPANATVNVVITTVVEDCVSISQTDGTLNQGAPIVLRHTCGPILGSAVAPPLSLRPPVVAQVVSDLAPSPPLVLEDIAGSGDCTHQRLEFQLARSGQAARFTVQIESVYSAAQAGVTINIPIPAGITVNDPPFVAPTDPAATYDNGSRTIHWIGDLPAMASVVITFEGVIDPAAGCESVLSVTGTTQACVNAGQCCQPPIQGSLSVFTVPQPPAGPHVLGIDSIHDAGYNYGLWYLEPGVHTTFQPLLCLPTCMYHRMARTPTGQFWMLLGPPLAYFDPIALDLRFFNAQDLQALGLLDVADVAVDPRDGSAVMSGTSLAGIPALVRYDPVTQQSAVISEDAALAGLGTIKVDAEGDVIDFDGASRLRRFDPTDPSNMTEYTVSNVSIAGEGDLGPMDVIDTNLLNFSIDTDGGYVVLMFKHYFRQAPFRVYELVQLGHIDRTSGAYSVIVDLLVGYGNAALPPSLTPLIPYVSQFGGLPVLGAAVDSRGSIYIGTGESPGRLHVVHRACTGQSGAFLGDGGPLLLQAINIEHSGHPATPGDCDFDGDVDDADAGRFGCCMTGPDAGPVAPECGCADFDGDTDADLEDVAEFQARF